MFPMLTALVAASAPAAPTYTKDVAPILWQNCAGCHRPGEVGPFPLLTYKDVAKRADFIAEVTGERRMPPWKAEPGFGEFHGERRLTDAQRHALKAWADAGAPEGDPKDLPQPPTFTEGWQAGEPDLVLKMPDSFKVPATGRDVYQCFVLPIPLDADKTVTAVEFRPGNRKVVHHAILYLDSMGQARKKDAASPEPGYQSFGGPGIVPTGSLGAWAPGADPSRLPDGVGRHLRKGSDLVLQVHYHPSGKAEEDRSAVGIHFAKKPVEKYAAGVVLRSRALLIPAGKKDYRVTAQSDPLPAAAEAIGVSPHMHYIGKTMKVVAATPEGKELPLIWIKDWDFNWQGSYNYAKPVRLPKGTVLKLEATYDNSADNPRNPSSPPKFVHWGEQTTDEMCLCGVQIVADNLADLRSIATMPGNRLGMLFGGTLPKPGEQDTPSSAFPEAGVPIPERAKKLLDGHDTDKDGRLSRDEYEAMPAALREAIAKYLEGRKGR